MIKKWLPRHTLAAFGVALIGIANILSAWLVYHPARVGWLHHYLPWVILRGSWLSSIVAGSVQLYLSWSLGRRKRYAWLITSIMLLVSTGSNLLRGLHYGQAAINFGLFLVLLTLRSEFTAASDPPSVRHGLVIFAGSALFTYLYGLLGFYLLDKHFHQNFSIFEASRQTIAFLTWLSTPELERPNRLARWFLDSLAIIQIGGLVYGLIMVLRPVVYRHTVLVADRKRAAAIVQKHGRSSLVHLTLLPDKVYYFSQSGESFVAYRLISNVAVVLGDPVGPQEDIPHLLAAFTAFCNRNDWYPAFYQVLPDFLALYQAHGYKTLKIGA